MSRFNYRKISENILSDLPERTRTVISRRFGFDTGAKQTLELVGKNYNITRERVRQIENLGMEKARERAETMSQNLFQYFADKINRFGGFKREDILLQELGDSDSKQHILFLLSVNNQTQRFPESNDFFPAWAMEEKSIRRARKIAESFIRELEKKNKPMTLSDSRIYKANSKDSDIAQSSIELSKRILRNSDGLCGFAAWPEINPRGIKDKAFLALKKWNKPMHFTEVADMIQKDDEIKKPYLFKTVHNELIKDNRFVLVGRGLYGLREWGYESGHVRDVILRALKQSGKPMPKSKILDYVLKQRFVKTSTVLLNLNNRDYFQLDNKGRYTIREI